MRTVTFETQIHDGIIKIPAKYSNFDTQNIKVILIAKSIPRVDAVKRASKTGNTARGILQKYKNPALISKEKLAWEMAVKEKHAHR
ncbi:MAG TPA: hypothetical protein VK186_15605 [Candidatus Deferrimicrobium sp.]|nr:hypothetical protein [Candidatus Kapabacteria bacterium]HLP60265.1 hypothetical protein [Candidatus Deferrimicrobium sp.]